MPALSGPRQLEPPLQQVGPNEESGAWEWRRAGGQPGIDPQPGEGTGGGPTRESLGTGGPNLFLPSYIRHPEGDMALSLSVYPV